MIKKFNDTMAIIVVGAIFALWILQGIDVVTLPGEVIGATIAGFTLIIQFYFRRNPPSNGNTT